jgi:hypothetical protein
VVVVVDVVVVVGVEVVVVALQSSILFANLMVEDSLSLQIAETLPVQIGLLDINVSPGCRIATHIARAVALFTPSYIKTSFEPVFMIEYPFRVGSAPANVNAPSLMGTELTHADVVQRFASPRTNRANLGLILVVVTVEPVNSCASINCAVIGGYRLSVSDIL